MFAGFTEGYYLGVSSGIVDNYQDVFMSPTRLGKWPYKVHAYLPHRAPQLLALGSGDLVEVTEERCIDKLDITDRTAGHLHPYLAN